MTLLLDTNVVLDVLAHRTPWYDHSAAVLSMAESGAAEAFVAAHGITTLAYLLTKHRGREVASSALLDLLEIVRVAEVSHETIVKGLTLGWADVEDAVHAVCALDAGADYFVTRNPADFRALTIPVVTPSQLVALQPG